MNKQIVTPKFRMIFPNLITPGVNLQNQMEWSVTALFPLDADISELKKACHAACAVKWGEDKSKWPTNLKTPFLNGNEQGKADTNGVFQPYAGHADTVLIRFKRKVSTKNGANQPPTVVMANPHITAKESDVYGGRWAKAVVHAFAYSMAGNHGVSFGLDHIQILDHDTPLGGGRANAADIFSNEDESAHTKAHDDKADNFLI